VRSEYADFGPTLASEYLEQHHGITVSRETLRNWMIGAGLWKKRKQRLLAAGDPCLAQAAKLLRRAGAMGHQRARVAGGSRAEDLFNRHDRRRHQSGAGAFRRTRFHRGEYAFSLGLDRTPEAIRGGLTDRAGLFETNRLNQRDEELQGKLPETQIGRVLRELGIG
jgi:hypothetical protein